ncbi:MAG: undecaprenyldiphospho-muramoylpentapeptide beta-N-acetylglucosaminyltransferase [Candidatus Omnitrophota bacterium]
MKILIACGGTGGHIFPGLSLAQELNARGIKDLLLAGTDHPLEQKLFGSFGLPYRLLPAAKISRNPLGFLKFIGRFMSASAGSIRLLSEYKPDIIVGFGGYASFPVCIFGALAGRKLFLHEQNCDAGLANKMLALFSRRVAVSFKETEKAFGKKAVFTGNPIRAGLLSAGRKEAQARYGLDPGRFTVLILGGSQGSQAINTVVGDMLGLLGAEEKAQLNIIHIAGMKNYNDVQKKYGGSGISGRVCDFVDEIGSAYAAADLIISRAGATALFEIAALGIPSIMIPYRFAGGHQYRNAAALKAAGGAIVMDEAGLTPRMLRGRIFGLKNDRVKLGAMSDAARRFAVPDAAKRLADIIL